MDKMNVILTPRKSCASHEVEVDRHLYETDMCADIEVLKWAGTRGGPVSKLSGGATLQFWTDSNVGPRNA